MNIIYLILILAVIGFLLWLLLTYVPMPKPFPQIIVGIAVVAVILWLLSAFGLLGGGPVIRTR
jgi:hypothetical protein